MNFFKNRYCSFFLAAILLALFIPFQAHSKTNILFILDGSNSMWGQINDEAKITSAQNVLSSLLRDLSAETNVGFMTYGHKSEDSCTDIEVLSGIGESGPDELIGKLNALKPKGRTPIAGALQKSLEVLATYEGDNNNVVLISDGVETCNGDPCAAAKALAEAGISARVHVVGFDVGEEERKQLGCIPEMGNGKYFSASNAAELKTAVAEVKEVAVAEAPVPEPKAEPVLWFEDKFDGGELSELWEVINPDPDAFIVEEGELLAINSTPAGFAEENITNLFRLTKPMPTGDWVMSAKLRVDFQTGQERIFFGLYEDKDNFLVNILSIEGGSCYPGGSHALHLFMTPTKGLKGTVTENRQEVWNINYCAGGKTTSEWMEGGQPMLIRVEKKGRTYSSAIRMEGDEAPQWKTLPGLRLLRAKGGLSLGLFQAGEGEGESSLMVDWVKIEQLVAHD